MSEVTFSAISFLAIFIYGTMILSILSILFLFISLIMKNTTIKNIIYIIVTIYSIFISFILLTAGPINYVSTYLKPTICILLAISGAVFKFAFKKQGLGYSLMVLSIIMGTIFLIII